MHFKKAALSIFLAVLAITGSRAHSQANVSENQTTYIYMLMLRRDPIAIQARPQHP